MITSHRALMQLETDVSILTINRVPYFLFRLIGLLLCSGIFKTFVVISERYYICTETVLTDFMFKFINFRNKIAFRYNCNGFFFAS